MKTGVAILVSDKIDFKTKNVTRDKERLFIMIKIHQGDITIISIYSLNNMAPKYMKQKLTEIKGAINNSTIIVGDFNTPLSIMCRAARKKIHKEREDLNNTINQLHLIGICRTLQPPPTGYTFLSRAHGTFSLLD